MLLCWCLMAFLLLVVCASVCVTTIWARCVLLVSTVCSPLLCQRLWHHIWHASAVGKPVWSVMSGLDEHVMVVTLAESSWSEGGRVNNVVSRVFADGRQGGWQRLD